MAVDLAVGVERKTGEELVAGRMHRLRQPLGEVAAARAEPSPSDSLAPSLRWLLALPAAPPQARMPPPQMQQVQYL